MSVDVMAAVFKHSKATANDRVVLLVLADHAHDDGTGAYPSQALIAAKSGGIGERTVRDCLTRLQTAGEIEKLGKRGKTVEYWVNVNPAEAAAINPADSRTNPADSRITTRRPTADKPTTEPSVEPSSAPLSYLLADLIEANGSKHLPAIETWGTSERLLIDRDGRNPDEAEALIRWCQADEFWRGVILSMPKFREKYDQLRLQAQRGSGKAPIARKRGRLVSTR